MYGSAMTGFDASGVFAPFRVSANRSRAASISAFRCSNERPDRSRVPDSGVGALSRVLGSGSSSFMMRSRTFVLIPDAEIERLAEKLGEGNGRLIRGR